MTSCWHATGHLSRTPRWVRTALLAALAYVLVVEVIGVLTVLARREEISGLVPSSYGTRVFLASFVGVATVIAGWWLYFRRENEGARVWAFVGSALLAIVCIVMWLSGSLSEREFPAYKLFGYPVCALALFAYGVFGRERLE